MSDDATMTLVWQSTSCTGTISSKSRSVSPMLMPNSWQRSGWSCSATMPATMSLNARGLSDALIMRIAPLLSSARLNHVCCSEYPCSRRIVSVPARRSWKYRVSISASAAGCTTSATSWSTKSFVFTVVVIPRLLYMHHPTPCPFPAAQYFTPCTARVNRGTPWHEENVMPHGRGYAPACCYSTLESTTASQYKGCPVRHDSDKPGCLRNLPRGVR